MFLRAVVAAGAVVLSGASFAGASPLVAQVAPPSDTFDWSGLITGALGSSPLGAVLFWQLTKREKDIAAKDAEIKRLNDRAADQFAPLLERVVIALKDVESGLGAQINRARPEDAAAVLSDLRKALEEFGRGRGQV